ncbi:hypothetical protein [Polaromonas sp.]|uniref:hypothetical protein n=1 Tax=Polaromonas sp. TaxID=1869339 RepID=UPI0032651FE5
MIAEKTSAREAQHRSPHDDRADAVRYAVLQRIAPAIRHDMVVNLQPIGMIYELMEHRVAARREDMLALQESSAKMSRFAKAALTSCIDSVTWLERDPGALVSLAEGVGESVAMLGRTFGFMGFTLVNRVDGTACVIPRDALRHTLTSALLAAIDTAPCPSDVILASEAGAHDLALSLDVVARPGQRVLQPFQENYRRLNWEDVEAIASVESVGFAHHGEGVTLFIRKREEQEPGGLF